MTEVKVLVIDDHDVVRKGISAVIAAEPSMRVVGEATTADEGLKALSETEVDVVILDIAMDGMSPFEMARSALTKKPSLKIIFLTAFTSDSNIERAWQSGAHGFISKRDAVNCVVEAIKTVMHGKAGFTSREVTERVGAEVFSQEFGLSQKTKPVSMLKRTKLSPREHDVLRCVALGQSAKQIAEGLSISAKTVERHKSNIMTKLSLHTQVDLARYAIREGLILP